MPSTVIEKSEVMKQATKKMMDHGAMDAGAALEASTQEPDHMFKCIILGETGVGKTCLLKQVQDGAFLEQHQVTIMVEFGFFSLHLTEENKVVKLQIWDTAGQEAFRSVNRIFYRGAHLVILAYDITNAGSFEDMGSWLKEVHDHCPDDVKIYLVGNKSELVD